MKPKAIIGIVFVIIGIVIIGFIAIPIIGAISHGVDDISNFFTGSNSIVVGIIFGIPVVACFLPGYYLIKSANK